MNPSYSRFLVLVLMVFVLSIMALPQTLIHIRPLAALSLIIYVQVFLPRFFNGVMLWSLGLVLDVLTGCVMGQHCLGFILVSWGLSERVRRFKFFTVLQQMTWVFFFCVVNQLCFCLVDWCVGYGHGFMYYFLPVCITPLCWPWMIILADRLMLYSVARDDAL